MPTIDDHAQSLLETLSSDKRIKGLFTSPEIRGGVLFVELVNGIDNLKATVEQFKDAGYRVTTVFHLDEENDPTKVGAILMPEDVHSVVWGTIGDTHREVKRNQPELKPATHRMVLETVHADDVAGLDLLDEYHRRANERLLPNGEPDDI